LNKEDPVAHAAIDIDAGDNIRLLQNSSVHVDSYGNRVTVPFTFKRYTEEAEGALRLTYKRVDSKETEIKIFGPDLPLILRVVNGCDFWVGCIGAVLLFALGSVVSKTNFAEALCGQALAMVSVLTGAVLQAIGALLGIMILGKKAF
jgi:hypothetical protein